MKEQAIKIVSEALPTKMRTVTFTGVGNTVSPYRSKDAENYVFARVLKYSLKYLSYYFDIKKENTTLVKRNKRLRTELLIYQILFFVLAYAVMITLFLN